MTQQTTKAFTLVELIVVITILAILGTIAFIALQGYSRDARDSLRISDFSRIKTSLEVFNTTKGIYPEPTLGTEITYSGAEVRTQGTMGDSVVINLSNLSKKPVDPLLGTEYVYSRLNTKKEYEIGGILEGDLAYNPILPQANASSLVSYVKGTYNGMVAKVNTGATTYVLSVPTIIGSDIGNVDIMHMIQNQKLAYNGFSNLPSSYGGLGYTMSGGFDYTPSDIVIFEGNISDLSDINNLKTLTTNLQTLLVGSDLEGLGDYANVINIDVNNNSEVTNLIGNLANNYLGANVEIVINGGGAGYVYSCDGLLGDAYNTQYSTAHTDFDLCTGTIILDSLSGIPTSSNLTNNVGARDVYAFVLEAGMAYDFETLGDDSNSDTVLYLYDKDGNQLIMNDDFESVYRSKFQWVPTYSGYYFVGVMGYADDGTAADYTLSISNYYVHGSCGIDNGKDISFSPVYLCDTGNGVNLQDGGVGSTYTWSCEGLYGGNSVSCSANHVVITGWPLLDTNCQRNDIVIGTQTWAGCNSTLGDGFEWGKKDDGSAGVLGSCYDYDNNLASCDFSDPNMLSNANALTHFNSVQPDGINQNGDKELNNIWGKLYTWNQAMGNTGTGACATGRHLPSFVEWEELETTLNGSNCRGGVNGHLCDGLGWQNYTLKSDTNNIVKALGFPLTGNRHVLGEIFAYRGSDTDLWLSTEIDVDFSKSAYLYNNYSTIFVTDRKKTSGFSARCIKD